MLHSWLFLLPLWYPRIASCFAHSQCHMISYAFFMIPTHCFVLRTLAMLPHIRNPLIFLRKMASCSYWGGYKIQIAFCKQACKALWALYPGIIKKCSWPRSPDVRNTKLNLMFRLKILFRMLTSLIAYCTGCLACRLAWCLAFTASTFFYGILKLFCI